jgi:hypothetical protein
VSAIVEDGGVSHAAVTPPRTAAEPLPFDFLEFLELRLGVQRDEAQALLYDHLRVAWSLGCASSGPGVARCELDENADAASA